MRLDEARAAFCASVIEAPIVILVEGDRVEKPAPLLFVPIFSPLGEAKFVRGRAIAGDSNGRFSAGPAAVPAGRLSSRGYPH